MTIKAEATLLAKNLLMLRRIPSWAATVLLISVVSAAQGELTTDFLMDQDPEFRAPLPVKRFKRDFKGLWLQSLQRPEADLQRMTAETVARAHLHGIPDLVELVPALETILTTPTSHPSARFAAARALIVLNARDSAPKLFEAGLSHGSELRQLVEPALADWDFGPVRTIWIKRLAAPEIRLSDTILAMNGLGKVRDASALTPLMAIVSDFVRLPALRLEAAQSAGAIAENGLEPDARRLTEEGSPAPLINRLCAVRLLNRHSSPDAREILIKLASESDASVVAAAMKRLNSIDPELVLPLADTALKHPDQHVREEGVFAYLRQPSVPRIKRLGELLDDAHPSVRKFVAEGLKELAKQPEFDEAVRTAGMQILNGSRWQGQSQAALLLGTLNHKAAANRLVELLDSTQSEVMINAAWGLRKLAETYTIPGIVEKIRRQTTARKLQTIRGVDEQVAHLFEACGVLKVANVEPLILKYIPKDLTMIRSRSAAIWALGWLHEATPNESLCNQLMGRFSDISSKDPEDPLVRQMCVVGIVRMKGQDHALALRNSISGGTPPTPLGLATRWAVRELTGEELPEPEPESVSQGVWFLEPLDLSQSPSR